jgi:Streptomyces sporulation and cell division protein, SsgA
MESSQVTGERIKRELTCAMSLDGTRRRRCEGIRLTARYDSCRPLALELEFHTRARPVWEIARWLFDEASVDRVGKGDVRMWREADELRIDLSSPDGFASLWLTFAQISEFVGQTYALVSAEEANARMREYLDATLEEIFTTADNAPRKGEHA